MARTEILIDRFMVLKVLVHQALLISHSSPLNPTSGARAMPAGPLEVNSGRHSTPSSFGRSHLSSPIPRLRKNPGRDIVHNFRGYVARPRPVARRVFALLLRGTAQEQME